MIKNTYEKNSTEYISYELGIMIACIEDSPTNTFLVDSIQRICEGMQLDISISSNGYKHYLEENFLDFDIEEMNAAFYKYGMELNEE